MKLCSERSLTHHKLILVCIRGLPVCVRGGRLDISHMGSPRSHNEKVRIRAATCIWGSRSSPIYIRGGQRSLFAYGDCMTHTPCMHTEIFVMPVCIQGMVSHKLYAHGKYFHMGNIKSCILVCKLSHTGNALRIQRFPYAYGRGSVKSSHLGIPVRITKLCAYGD